MFYILDIGGNRISYDSIEFRSRRVVDRVRQLSIAAIPGDAAVVFKRGTDIDIDGSLLVINLTKAAS